MQNTAANTRETYRERLTPGLWLIATIALAGPMISLVLTPFDSALALIVGAAVALALVALSISLSPTIRVADGRLYAGRAHIDAAWLGEPEEFRGEDARARRTHLIDRSGWNLLRGGIDGLVVVANIDPADPVSSWTISSRTPDRLAAAIRDARRARD